MSNWLGLTIIYLLGAILIVVGYRRRSPAGKFLLGSDAQQILLEAPCPVLAVRPADEDGDGDGCADVDLEGRPVDVSGQPIDIPPFAQPGDDAIGREEHDHGHAGGDDRSRFAAFFIG